MAVGWTVAAFFDFDLDCFDGFGAVALRFALPLLSGVAFCFAAGTAFEGDVTGAAGVVDEPPD